jgi:hypothetical protein
VSRYGKLIRQTTSSTNVICQDICAVCQIICHAAMRFQQFVSATYNGQTSCSCCETLITHLFSSVFWSPGNIWGRRAMLLGRK